MWKIWHDLSWNAPPVTSDQRSVSQKNNRRLRLFSVRKTGGCVVTEHVKNCFVKYSQPAIIFGETGLRSFLWLTHYKVDGKDWNPCFMLNLELISNLLILQAHFFVADLLEVIWGHSRSVFCYSCLLKPCDPNEIDRWNWCQCVCLAKAHRLMYTMTYWVTKCP